MNPMNAMEKIDEVFVTGLPLDSLANPLTALVYDERFNIGEIFQVIATSATKAGLRLGGVIEKPVAPLAPGRRCDMILQDLVSGEMVKISEDRGALARGCRLDHDGLARTCALVLSNLRHCDLVLLNKFGKTEAEGGGFRCIISDALGLETPVVIGVPRRNLEAWRAFAGDFGVEVEAAAFAVSQAA
jgi:nucleoside-triphosphatase THEP1